MSGYDNTNSGILGRNERKTEDKHPDFTGKLNVEGRDYYLDGWIKERKDGSGRFFSLRVKPKDSPIAHTPAHSPQCGGGKPMPDDDIPF